MAEMLVGAAALTSKDVLDAFLAPAAVSASLITGMSGFLAGTALVVNAGRPGVYSELANAVNAGLGIGFLLSLLPTLYTLVIALQSLK